MKRYNTIFCLLFISGILYAQEYLKRESILDQKSSLSDSIIYHIDSIQPLCLACSYNGTFIEIEDCKLYCEVEGNGIPIVLINGGPGGTHHCFHLWFSKAQSFSTVIYYDQRGCGWSDYQEGSGYSFRQAVEDLEKLRVSLGFEKWIVTGYSYGGALSQYYAIKYPEHTAGIVLVGSTPLLGNSIPKGTRQQMFITQDERQRMREITQLYNRGELNDIQFQVNKNLNGDWKRQNFYKPAFEDLVRSALYEWNHDDNFRQKVGWGYKQYNFGNVFTECPIPTLILEGEWDLTWTEEKKDIFNSSHPNAKYYLVKNAGHAIFKENTETFFTLLEEFINSLKPLTVEQIEIWERKIWPLIQPQEELFSRENDFIRLIETQGIDCGLKYFSDFKRINPGLLLFTEDNMNNLGYSFWRTNDFITALEVFKLNLEVYPDSGLIYENLGDSYIKMGNTQMAIQCFRKSLELEPKNQNLKQLLENLLENSDYK